MGGAWLRSVALYPSHTYDCLSTTEQDKAAYGAETYGFANDITKCANDSERSVYWNGTYFFLTGGFNGRVREMWFAGDSQAYGDHGFAYYNIIYIKIKYMANPSSQCGQS